MRCSLELEIFFIYFSIEHSFMAEKIRSNEILGTLGNNVFFFSTISSRLFSLRPIYVKSFEFSHI